jgi:hypothetical protein
MAAAPKMPTNELVHEFLSLPTHGEKCAFFHLHPELGQIFGVQHFPKPETKPSAPATTEE